MPLQPLLLFPSPTSVDRASLGGGGSRLRLPNAAEQERRLKQKFLNISAGISALQPTVQGLEPEQVIVFVTVGDSISKLSEAARHIPGLEWLAELDLEDYVQDATFNSLNDPSAGLTQRLYALMTNRAAMDQLLSLWNRWVKSPGTTAARHFGPFKDLFRHLSDVRRWGPEDRLDQTLLVEDWRDSLSRYPNSPVRFEAELWFRGSAAARATALTELTGLVESQRGLIRSQAAVASIMYHGVLIEMPAASVTETLQRVDAGEYTDLLRCEGVMFFRPMAQAVFSLEPNDRVAFSASGRDLSAMPVGSPRVALLDGYPAALHELLSGRLQIDDPDDFGSNYEPEQQEHGTSMASLIALGDLSEPGPSLKSPIYVRPIFVPFDRGNREFVECTPTDELLVDLIHRAIKRVAEGEMTRDSVRIINLSLGDALRPFIRELSPLARVIDWLSWQYRLLINVSSGNQVQPICLTCSGDDFARLPDDDAVRMALSAIDGDQSARRHFSPAEAVNAVTVGAVHADSSALVAGDRRVDLLRGRRLPSPISTVSRGFKRAVKPEIQFPGGRLMYRSPIMRSGEHWEFTPASGKSPPGLQVAAPGTQPLEMSRTVYSCGSSNATALATRTSCLIVERLEELLAERSDVEIDQSQMTTLTKALLVHGASWGSAQGELERLLTNSTHDWRFRQSLNAKFLGFGEVDPIRCLNCTDQRATLLGWGYLPKDSAHSYSFPLPPALSARKLMRRLTITLAWLSPVNPAHRDYRKAALWCSFDKEVLGVQRASLDFDTAKRGTVIHQVFEGEIGRSFIGDLEIKVNCREQAAKLSEQVPYGLAVTLEVAEGTRIPLYAQVRDQIRAAVPIAPRS